MELGGDAWRKRAWKRALQIQSRSPQRRANSPGPSHQDSDQVDKDVLRSMNNYDVTLLGVAEERREFMRQQLRWVLNQVLSRNTEWRYVQVRDDVFCVLYD